MVPRPLYFSTLRFFRHLLFSCLRCISKNKTILCIIIQLGSVINNILVHNPVKQIISIKFIMVMESKYNILKISTQKSIMYHLFEQFRARVRKSGTVCYCSVT